MTDTESYQDIRDFHVGDVVRRNDRHSMFGRLLELGDKAVVTAVLPDPAKDLDSKPGQVGSLMIEGSNSEWGHLLFDLPRPEDQPDTVENLQARLAEVEDVLRRERATAEEQAAIRRERYDEVDDALQQARSELEQANAATALEAHRANRAERKAQRLQHAVDYAQKFLPEDQKGRVQGYLDGLRRVDR